MKMAKVGLFLGANLWNFRTDFKSHDTKMMMITSIPTQTLSYINATNLKKNAGVKNVFDQRFLAT